MVTAVESALERELSHIIIGQALVEQGEPDDELFLLVDGSWRWSRTANWSWGRPRGHPRRDGAARGGRRTATLRAVTRCWVAVVPGDRVDRQALAEVARRRREDTP
jgi:hypothetical protein